MKILIFTLLFAISFATTSFSQEPVFMEIDKPMLVNKIWYPTDTMYSPIMFGKDGTFIKKFKSKKIIDHYQIKDDVLWFYLEWYELKGLDDVPVRKYKIMKCKYFLYDNKLSLTFTDGKEIVYSTQPLNYNN